MSDEIDISELDTADELIAERRGDPGQVPDDMEPWMGRLIIGIDVFILWTGRIACLLLVPMLAVMVYEVVARKLFVAPTLWAYDISRMICGAMFMAGAAYALLKGVHIRADFLYRLMPQKRQAAIDLALYILFYFPALIVFFWISADYFWDSFIKGERSMDTTWAPLLWPGRIAMPMGALLLIIQGVSEALKCVYAIRRGRWP
ncbi:MAG: TRAP transporter small permease subunit [Rhodospirillaceae bacterium]|nr:TRAP transporter small permease subunit [Rhodospirillaceae bacterium]